MTENITAMGRARSILMLDQHKDSERYMKFPVVVSYRSNFLPEGSETVCFTFEQLDRQIAALVFSSNGSEEARADLYAYFDEAVKELTHPDKPANGAHFGYTKDFGPSGNLRFETEYDMFIRVPGMQD